MRPHEKPALGSIWENRKPGMVSLELDPIASDVKGLIGVEAVVDGAPMKMATGDPVELPDGEHALQARVTYVPVGTSTPVTIRSYFHFSTEKECRAELHIGVASTNGTLRPTFSEKLSAVVPSIVIWLSS